MQKLIVATNNKGKIAEIKTILGDRFDVRSLSDEGIVSDPKETGTTFEENAEIKARAVFALTNAPTLADDSGLIVDALGGAPGVFSARYAGENASAADNNRLLLKNMLGKKDRKARFYCAVILCRGENDIISASGSVEGEILHDECGTGGFGYDPLFYSEELKKSFGLASAEEKNAISHRARALRALCEKIKKEDGNI